MKVLKRREYATIAYDYELQVTEELIKEINELFNKQWKVKGYDTVEFTLEDICDTWSWDDNDSEVLKASIDYVMYADGSTYSYQYDYEVREGLRDMLNDYVWGVEPETFDYNTDEVYDTIEEN